jgi:3-oxoacyl-[acyl-carrier protein] reductase
VGHLDDKVAIITGAARGIGRAYALGFVQEGAAVAAADLSDPSPVVEEIVATGGKALAVHVDVADEASTKEMARTVFEHFGRIDILVNNAAYMTTAVQGPFEDFAVEEWDRVFQVNVRGSWLCAKAVAPYMREQNYGKIVNISSMTAIDGTPTLLHYLSSKAAVVGLTRGLATELGENNITVNTVTPDYIPHDPQYDARQPEGQGAWIISRRPLRREEVPEDMVGAVVFLSSPGSDFITGQNLVVNGGATYH